MIGFNVWFDNKCAAKDVRFDDQDLMWDSVILPVNRALQWGECVPAIDESYYFKATCTGTTSINYMFFSDPDCAWESINPTVTYENAATVLNPRDV